MRELGPAAVNVAVNLGGNVDNDTASSGTGSGVGWWCTSVEVRALEHRIPGRKRADLGYDPGHEAGDVARAAVQRCPGGGNVVERRLRAGTASCCQSGSW
jgi:hypothetical protein